MFKVKKYNNNLLGNICEITTGKLDANAMEENGKYRFYTCAREYYFINRYEFDTEALLISGNGANVGYIHHYKGKFNAYQRTYVLMNIKIDIVFLKYFLESNLYKRINREKNSGNTPYITMPTLHDMPIAYPSLQEEQQKIGLFLSAIDELIELKQKSLSLIKQELDYRINDIIGKINLKSISKNKIGELFKISVGGDIPKEGYSENKDHIFKYPIFSNSLVNNGLYGYSKTFTKLKNTITVTGRGEIGKAVVRRENYYPIVRLLSLTPIFELDLNYFANIINKINIFNDQTGVPQLTAPKLSNYEIFYVSDINIQRKIGNIIEEKERVIDLYRKQIIEFQKYKSYYLDVIFNKGDKNA